MKRLLVVLWAILPVVLAATTNNAFAEEKEAWTHPTRIQAVGIDQIDGALATETELQHWGIEKLTAAITNALEAPVVGFQIKKLESATDGYVLEFNKTARQEAFSVPANKIAVVAITEGPVRTHVAHIVEQTRYCKVDNAQFTSFTAKQIAMKSEEAWKNIIEEMTRLTYAPVGGMTADVAQSDPSNFVLSFKTAPAPEALSSR